MRSYQLAILASLAAAPAFAQTTPAPFAPWTVTEQDAQQIATFLGDVPSKYANPILQWMGQREQQAQQQAQVEKAKAEKAKEAPATAPGDAH